MTRAKQTERTAIYCRYSSTNQDKGVSIELQLETCRKLAGTKPLEFVDRAVSGRTMHRASFIKMLDAAERGEFDRLIVYKWDRFGRNAETHATIADLEDLGIKVSSATEGDDFLARGVGLLVSEDYSRKLSERVQQSMRVRFRNSGTFMGGYIPYGYTKERGADELSRLIIEPAEAAAVRRVFDLKIKRNIGCKKIAAILTTEGYKPRSGGRWGWTTINHILRNEIYVGTIRYGKTSEKLDRRTGRATRIVHDESKHLVRHDESLRLISDKDFKTARDLIDRACYRDYRLPKDVRIFSQRVVCGLCGSIMFTRHTSLQRPIVYHYLVCGKRDKYGKGSCGNPTRPAERDLIDWVQEGFRTALASRDRILKRAMEIAEASLDRTEGRRSQIEGELTKIEAGIARLSRMMRDDSLSDVEMRGLLVQMGELEGERETLNGSMRAVASDTGVDRKRLLAEINGAFTEASEAMQLVSEPTRLNRVIERYCGRIVVLPDGTFGREERAGFTDNRVSRR